MCGGSLFAPWSCGITFSLFGVGCILVLSCLRSGQCCWWVLGCPCFFIRNWSEHVDVFEFVLSLL